MVRQALAPIENEWVRLRLLTEADLPLTLAWRNRDDIRFCFIHSDVITPEQHRAWFENHCTTDDHFVFIIEERKTLHRPVGQISLYHIDREAKRAEFGRLMIGEPDARGQSLAKQATQLLLEAAFGQFGLQEVYLEVFEHNAPAIAIYRSCGFQPCGRRDDLLFMRLIS